MTATEKNANTIVKYVYWQWHGFLLNIAEWQVLKTVFPRHASCQGNWDKLWLFRPLACVLLLSSTYFFAFLDDEGGASGDDYLKVDSAWHGDIDSDAESVDSEEEDPLK